MTGVRRAYLDLAPGEARGVITLDGRPERLLIVREDDPTPRLGARYAARVEAVSVRMGLARLDLGEAAGTLRVRGDLPDVGRRLVVEVVAEPVRGKPATLRLVENAAPAGSPGRLTAGPSLPQLLAELAGTDPVVGDLAREEADGAQFSALAMLHSFAGVTLAVEPTRALTAVDVDLAENGPPVAQANLIALAEAARLLRLKALGGLIALDLIGFPKSHRALVTAAESAFAPDGAEVAIAPPSRFGVMEIAKPHLHQPLHEQLMDTAGRPSARTLAQATVRDLDRQGRFAPGDQLLALRAPDIAAIARPLVARLGPCFQVAADPGVARESTDILSR